VLGFEPRATSPALVIYVFIGLQVCKVGTVLLEPCI
jgi:hypothetical protein